MPRLSYPQATKGDAIYALLELCRNDPDFMKELEQLRGPYMALLDRFSIDALDFFLNTPLSSKEYFQAALDYDPSQGETAPFPGAEQFPYFAQLQPYFDGLGQLAHKWKLRARWAVLTLFILDILDCWKAKGMPTEFDIPLEKFDSLYPWEPPAPPLTIAVPAWAVVLLGRKVVLKEVAKKLRQYGNQIKAAGLKEYPSALKTHARWWFEHYVKGKTYAELGKEFPRVGQETIKRKVWEFSKLVGIKTR
jgi:hypothetical protein